MSRVARVHRLQAVGRRIWCTMPLLSLFVVATVSALAITPLANAAVYPTRPIQLVVTYAPGGGTDLVGRSFARAAEKVLGQQITVVNRVGGSGAVGWAEVAKARPDGYTLTLIARPLLVLPELGLSPVTHADFEPIALLNEDPAVVLVKAGSRYNSVSGLIEQVRRAPGSVRFASSAAPDLYLTALEIALQVRFNLIPYNGASEAITSVVGGHTEFTMVNYGEAASQIKAGQLVPLAVLSERRLRELPGVPTMKELGYDVVASTWRGLAAPKGTPSEVIEVIASATAKAVEDPDFVQTMSQLGFSITYLPSERFREFIDQDSQRVRVQVEYWKSRK